MKKFILLCLIAVCANLSACAGFVPSSQDKTTSATTTTKSQARPIRNHIKNKLQTSRISLDDSTDLNLKNYEPTQGNLWDEIGKGFKIQNQEERPEVQAQIRWFVNHPKYLERMTERARPYLYIVYHEAKSRNLPTELVLLPINESSYYPFSSSSKGAAGIWQLMPGTASDFGLKRNFWYDGRRDIFDSTNAALDYLTYLAHYFNNDWLLAIAAYDTGEGNVERAIARNTRAGLSTDFWSLHLASETRAYVPQLLALAVIIEHPERYPINLPPVDARPVVAPVHINGQLKLTDAARFAGISVNQLKVLNPGLSHISTDPSNDSKILLPIDTIESFKTNVSNFANTSSTDQAPTPSYGRYRVQRRDTLQSIANRFSIPTEALKDANNITGNHVPTGRVLKIPDMTDRYKPTTAINLDQTSLDLSSNTTTQETIPEKNTNKTITLTSDSPSISQNTITKEAADSSYSPTIDMSANDNDNSDASTEVTSKTTTVVKGAIAPPVKHVIKHKIAKGETLSSISRRYHVSAAQLAKLNPGIQSRSLKPGMIIVIQTTNQSLAVSPTHKTFVTKTKLSTTNRMKKPANKKNLGKKLTTSKKKISQNNNAQP